MDKSNFSEKLKMKHLLFAVAVLVLIYSCNNQKCSNLSVLERAEIPCISGESKMIFHPNPEPENGEKWFTNDHCFVIDSDSTLHWLGINNPFPPEGKELYRYHPYLGHLSTNEPMSNWKRLPWALDESKGTEYLGAPFVIWHDESQRWAMVVETWLDKRRLEVCWSKDLINWERTKKAILPEELWISTRDPHIMKGEDGKYWIHVVSTGNNGVKQSQVLRIKTKDFINFEKPQTILGIDDNNWATLIESPSLLERNGLWYLFFTYAHRRYTETIVVVSDSPDIFDYNKNTLTTIFGHAAKVFKYKNETYISSCGPEDHQYLNQHGVTLAKLKWLKQ
jgi:Glycosyl hydrolases family 32 N-terminal domain